MVVRSNVVLKRKKKRLRFSKMNERGCFFPVGLDSLNAILLQPFLNLVQPLVSHSFSTQTGMNASPERSLQPCCVVLWACQT